MGKDSKRNVVVHKLVVDEFEGKVRAYLEPNGWGAKFTYPLQARHNLVLVSPLRSGLEIYHELTSEHVTEEFRSGLEKIGQEYGVQLGITPTAYRK